MTTVHATFDLDLYPPTAVVRAVHRFSGTHTGQIERVGDKAHVVLLPRTGNGPDVRADLVDAVDDEARREDAHARGLSRRNPGTAHPPD